MSSEAGHIQITEFNKEVIPSINWMMEDLFCQYGVSLPWFMCDFDFPDFSQRPDWVSGYNFNLDWGPWGYWLPWFNELLGLLFDEAHLPRWQMPDLSPGSWAFFNDYTEILYDNMQRHYVYGQSGTFIKDEVIEGETSGITGWYKWIDGDGYIHVANKQDTSGESVADFEEEKIVGADSGAYAWTYEDYPYYTTYYRVSIDPSQVKRYAEDCGAGYCCDDAWDLYLSNPSYETGKYIVNIVHLRCCECYPCGGEEQLGSQARGVKYYLKFDTSEAEATPTSAVLRVYIDQFDKTAGLDDPTLRLYSQDWGDEVDTGDWTGGVLEDSRVITSSDEDTWIEFNVSLDSVNIGGDSKFKLSFKEIDDGDTLKNGDRILSIFVEKAHYRTQLKLGYNEE